MGYVADLHTHSKYAGACSSQLNIPNLATWAKYKGIHLVGTGDALHPLYQKELQRDLTNFNDGVYEVNGVKFMVTGEVSCIYSEGGKTRRIHIIILYPDLDAALKLSETLSKLGAKLASDGRPILGMSSKRLCELVFKTVPEAIIIPAHIWTPWFSLYGSNSGYDKLTDCFGEFSDEILAVETGLSSELAMNWRVGELDTKSIVSFSDLHSLPRLGREVTIFGGTPTFANFKEALKTQNIIGTIEFFPEEGKYHYSGHRNCNIVYDPKQLKANGEICPICKRKLTIGVMQRVEELATRSIEDLRLTVKDGITTSEAFPERAGFRMLVQLEEILAESFEVAVKTQKVETEYHRLVTQVDTELKLLTKTPIELLQMTAGDRVAEGIKRVRGGTVTIEPGFDNTYGKVSLWTEEEKAAFKKSPQEALF